MTLTHNMISLKVSLVLDQLRKKGFLLLIENLGQTKKKKTNKQRLNSKGSRCDLQDQENHGQANFHGFKSIELIFHLIIYITILF